MNTSARWLTAGVVITALLSMGGTFPTPNREIFDKAQARLSYGTSVRFLSSGLSLRVQACHRARLKGKISAAIDCNDPWSWNGSGYSKGHAGLLRDLERFENESAESTATIVSPDQLGYVSCPAPCDAITIDSFATAGDCLECHDLISALSTWVTLLGTPPVSGDRFAIKCQGVIGRGIVRYITKRFKLQHKCEFKHEVAKDGYENFGCIDIGAPGHPMEVKVNRYRQRLINSVARQCDKTDVTTLLDTCGVDGLSVGACLATTIEQWAGTMHPLIYPPLPPP